jgi:hypothetical protein
MLNWMERLIRMRKEAPEIGWGEYTGVEVDQNGILAVRYDWRDISDHGFPEWHSLGGAAIAFRHR